MFSGKTLYSHGTALHTGVQLCTCKWVLVALMLGVTQCDGLASHPGGVAEIHSTETRTGSDLMNHFWSHMQTLPLLHDFSHQCISQLDDLKTTVYCSL